MELWVPGPSAVPVGGQQGGSNLVPITVPQAASISSVPRAGRWPPSFLNSERQSVLPDFSEALCSGIDFIFSFPHCSVFDSYSNPPTSHIDGEAQEVAFLAAFI